jgi:hypothetical protein
MSHMTHNSVDPRRYPQAVDNVADLALILGASLRLTRLITTDTLGQWWVVEPLASWVPQRYQRYLSGLDCPYCVGFHATFAVISSYAVARRTHSLTAWRVVAGSLAVNYITAHISARLDEVDDIDDVVSSSPYPEGVGSSPAPE